MLQQIDDLSIDPILRNMLQQLLIKAGMKQISAPDPAFKEKEKKVHPYS